MQAKGKTEKNVFRWVGPCLVACQDPTSVLHKQCCVMHGLSEFVLSSWAPCSEMSGNYKWKLVRKAIAPAFSTANLKCAPWSPLSHLRATATTGKSLLCETITHWFECCSKLGRIHALMNVCITLDTMFVSALGGDVYFK